RSARRCCSRTPSTSTGSNRGRKARLLERVVGHGKSRQFDQKFGRLRHVRKTGLSAELLTTVNRRALLRSIGLLAAVPLLAACNSVVAPAAAPPTTKPT